MPTPQPADFHAVTVTAYPDDPHHSPLPADTNPAAARLVPAGQVADGDLVLGVTQSGQIAFLSSPYRARPSDFDPACTCGTCSLLPPNASGIVLQARPAGRPCDCWDTEMLLLVIPAALADAGGMLTTALSAHGLVPDAEVNGDAGASHVHLPAPGNRRILIADDASAFHDPADHRGWTAHLCAHDDTPIRELYTSDSRDCVQDSAECAHHLAAWLSAATAPHVKVPLSTVTTAVQVLHPAAVDAAKTLSCPEIEALAELLADLGQPKEAEYWRAHHSVADDCTDHQTVPPPP